MSYSSDDYHNLKNQYYEASGRAAYLTGFIGSFARHMSDLNDRDRLFILNTLINLYQKESVADEYSHWVKEWQADVSKISKKA